MLTPLAAARRALARVRNGRPDAGISLVELLVTMGLMSIVAALALNWLLGATSASNKASDSSFATSDARNVLSSWPALLRVADAPLTASGANGAPLPVQGAGTGTGRFVSITPMSISFNADLNNRPTCTTVCARTATTLVTLSIVPITVRGTATNKLVQTLTKPDGTVSTVTLVASGAGQVPGATAGSTACLFTAYDANGVPLNPACSSATPLAAIARVDLAFTVTPSDGPTIGGTMQTFQTSIQITGNITPVVAATATVAP